MKKVFLDTNIVIDLLEKREPFFNVAAKIFSLADNQVIELYCSALSIANIYYILFRNKTNDDAYEILNELMEFLNILSFSEKTIKLSLQNRSFLDFEDAIQHSTAVDNQMDVIVTRNTNDFKAAKIPVMTSNEIVKYFEN